MADMNEYEQQVEALAEQMDESTGLSWLWAFLFGPLWFLFTISGKWFLITLILNLMVIGVILNPFLAYMAHRSLARQKAEKAYLSGVRA